MKIFIAGLILIVAFLIGTTFIFDSSSNQQKEKFIEDSQVKEKPEAKILINGEEIEVAVADTLQERVKGLSGRERVPFQGILFVFDSSTERSFWMKGMQFAIDIVWINKDFEIVGIESEVAPETFPETFKSEGSVMYVLEIPAGFSETYGLKVGSEVRILFLAHKN
jgi:uncharacterized protein